MINKTHPTSRNVIVTGAGGGLGREVSKAFARNNDRVACIDIDKEQAQTTAEEIGYFGGSAWAFSTDIAVEDDIRGLVHEIHDTIGEIDVVANVAGIMDRRQLRELNMSDFAQVLSVNVVGAYGMIRAFEQDLRNSCHGRIVNVASQSGTTGYEFPAYSTSKAAVIHLTRSLMLDFWGSDVRVNAISPGPMSTPMLNDSLLDTFSAATPTGRISKPEEVAACIIQLADCNHQLINGQNIVVDGGATSFFRWIDSNSWKPPYEA